MLFLFMVSIFFHENEKIDWSLPSFEANDYQNLRLLCGKNNLNYTELHTATWWIDKGQTKTGALYKGVRLTLSNIFSFSEYAVLCFRIRPIVRPGPDIVRFILFSRDGKYFDSITLDKNGKNSLFKISALNESISISFLNIATPPDDGCYWIGVIRNDDRIVFGVRLNQSKATGEVRLFTVNDRLHLIFNSF